MDNRVLKRIENLMLQKNWSVYQLAENAELERTTVQRWFAKESTEPTMATLEKVCNTLGITISQLYCFGDTMEVDERDKELVLAFRLLSEEDKQTVEKIVMALNKSN